MNPTLVSGTRIVMLALIFYTMALKMESFKGVTPYQSQEEAEASHLKFIQTYPLPVVKVRVNESEEVNFIIDTGGSEVIIDTEFAKKAGAEQFGSEKGTFGGGKQAACKHV